MEAAVLKVGWLLRSWWMLEDEGGRWVREVEREVMAGYMSGQAPPRLGYGLVESL